MTFFSEYYVNNQGKTAQYANIYLDEDALIVDSNTIMTFSGDILKRAASADMLEVGTYTIAPDNWKDSSGYTGSTVQSLPCAISRWNWD